MVYEAARWRLNSNKWSPWHYRSALNRSVICGDETWLTTNRENVSYNPRTVNCEKCALNLIYMKDLQNYNLLVADATNLIGRSKFKDGSSLVIPACNLADKHELSFKTAYGLLCLKMLGGKHA